MRILGNILWIIFGGLISAIGWWAAGLLWCCTVIGIPVGIQCFKLSSISDEAMRCWERTWKE